MIGEMNCVKKGHMRLERLKESVVPVYDFKANMAKVQSELDFVDAEKRQLIFAKTNIMTGQMISAGVALN